MVSKREDQLINKNIIKIENNGSSFTQHISIKALQTLEQQTQN